MCPVLMYNHQTSSSLNLKGREGIILPCISSSGLVSYYLFIYALLFAKNPPAKNILKFVR